MHERLAVAADRGAIAPSASRGARRGEEGAVLLEFAIVFPLLAMILLAIVSGGTAYNQKLQITHATREGARFAATVPTDQTFSSGTWAGNVQAMVIEHALGDLTGTGTNVCVSLVQGSSHDGTLTAVHSTSTGPCISPQGYPTTANDAGLRVQVTASRPGKLELGPFGLVNFTISSQATAKSEAPL